MWWKAFEDRSEPYFVFRKNSLGGAWTLGYVAALCTCVAILGVPGLPYLVLPTAICGLCVFLTYVTGLVGMAVLAPVLAYGWLCLVWFAGFGTPALEWSARVEAWLLACFIFIFLIGAPHVRGKLLVMVVLETLFYASVAFCVFWALAPELEGTLYGLTAAQFVERIAGGFFVAGGVLSLVLLCVACYQLSRGARDVAEVRQQLLYDLALLMVGFVPPVLGSLTARVIPVLAPAVVLLCYAALAVLAKRHGAERVCWALVPLVVMVTLAAVAQSPLDNLPAFGPGEVMIGAVRDGALGRLGMAVATPLFQATDQVMGGAARTLFQRGVENASSLVGTNAQEAVKLIGKAPVASQGGGLMLLLEAYALSFFSSVIMGTVVCAFDLKALVSARKESTTGGSAEVAGAGNQAFSADSPSTDASVTENGQMSALRLLPSWFVDVPLKDLVGGLKRDKELLETSQGSTTDAQSTKRAYRGPLPQLIPLDVRVALGLPTAEVEGAFRIHRWDEQLSGQSVARPNARISQFEQLRVQKRLEQPVRSGLWWKVFEDDGRLSVIPKSDLFGTILAVAALFAILLLIGAEVCEGCAVPISLILLTLGVGYVLGLVGVIVTGPVLVYGWSALAWYLFSGVLGEALIDMGIADPLRILGVVLIISSFTTGMRRQAGGTVALAFYGVAVAWYSGRSFLAGTMDIAAVRASLDFVYIASLLFAALFTLRALYKEAQLLRRWPEGVRDEVKSVALVFLGVVPLLVARTLSGAGPVVLFAAATACYAVLAVAGRLLSPKGLSCVLLPLMVGAACVFVQRYGMEGMPPSFLTDLIGRTITGDGLVGTLASGALPVVDAITQLLGKAVTNTLAFVLEPAFAALWPDLGTIEVRFGAALTDVFSFYPGVFVIASLMGVAVSVMEKVRPQLVERSGEDAL